MVSEKDSVQSHFVILFSFLLSLLHFPSPIHSILLCLQIVTNYNRVASVTAMLDKVDFVIMPVLNVDGYVYTWTEVS